MKKYTYNELYREILDILEPTPNIPSDEDALTILSLATKRSPEELEEICDFFASRAQINKALRLARRRSDGEPMAYLAGRFEFLGRPFFINNSVIIPSRDTEILVKNALAANLAGRVLDIGSGCGVIGISLAYYNKDVKVDLLDISKRASRLAFRNILKNRLLGRVRTKTADLFSATLSGYDAIVANPPYLTIDQIPQMRSEVRDFEPYEALNGGVDGLIFYRHIAKNAPSWTRPGAQILLEFGIGQDEAVLEIFEQSGNYRDIRMACDPLGFRRFLGASVL